MTRFHRIYLYTVFALALVMAACTDQQLTKLSQALNDVAQANNQLAHTIIDANKAGTLSDSDAAAILGVNLKIAQAGQQATALTRNLTKLAPADRTGVLNVLKPVLAAVNDAVASGLVGIKDPVTKSRVQAVLVTIQTGLNAAQVVLAGTT